MTKNLFKWMMAFAIVASPMMFTACGDDDDNNGSSSGGESLQDKTAVIYYVGTATSMTFVSDTAKYVQQVANVEKTFLVAIASTLGKNYDGSVTAFSGQPSDSTKVRIACDAVAAQLQDIELYGGSLVLSVEMKDYENERTTVSSYSFGLVSKRHLLDFEGAQLNSDKYWIGDSINGTKSQGLYGPLWACTYTEEIATVNTTYGGSYWNGFAISARTDTVFNDNYAGPDQYNNIVGKAKSENNFLIVQGTYGEENITFSKPVQIHGFYYTNAAVTVKSILNGDDYSGDKFNENDWLKCTVTATIAGGETKTYEIDLASNGEYVKTWKATKGLDTLFDNVLALSFKFSGSRTGEYGLNTPAYMCIDRMVYYEK